MLTVNMENFEGPLDLLLQLIQKNKLSICEVSISKIADEFFETVEHMKVEDIDSISDFIYISSKLIEIKSRYMLGLSREKEEEDELVFSLEEYSKYKQLSYILKKLYNTPIEYYEKIPEEIYVQEELDFSKLNIKSMENSVKKMLEEKSEKIAFTRKQKSLTEKIVYIAKYLEDKKICYFEELMQEDKVEEKVVSMLGVLQLAKESHINVRQRKNFGMIKIQKAE